MTERKRNWMTFFIVWGIILVVLGIASFVIYRIVDKTFFHTEPELFEETKYQHALYEASDKSTEETENYQYGGKCTFMLSKEGYEDDWHSDNGELFKSFVALKVKEEWHINTDFDKNFTISLTYRVFGDKNELLGIHLNESCDRLIVERHRWEEGPLASFYNTYYRYYRIENDAQAILNAAISQLK